MKQVYIHAVSHRQSNNPKEFGLAELSIELENSSQRYTVSADLDRYGEVILRTRLISTSPIDTHSRTYLLWRDKYPDGA